MVNSPRSPPPLKKEMESSSPPSPCPNTTTPFFTAPSSPSSSPPSYKDYHDVDNLWHHRFDRWGDHGNDDDDDDDEVRYAGDFEFEFNGLLGKVSSASANDLFLEGKIRSLSGVGSSMEMDSAGDSEREEGDRIEYGSCPTPRLRVCDILVQGEEEEEDGGDGNISFMPAARDRAAETEATAAATSACSVGYLSSLLPRMSLKKHRSHNKSWSFKDFLFRSTSEGRGTSKAAELVKVRSSPESRGRGRRGRTVSAHELHYQENRMVSEEMRRRTTLPYKHGFFACLGQGGDSHVARSLRSGTASFAVGSNRR